MCAKFLAELVSWSVVGGDRRHERLNAIHRSEVKVRRARLAGERIEGMSKLVGGAGKGLSFNRAIIKGNRATEKGEGVCLQTLCTFLHGCPLTQSVSS